MKYCVQCGKELENDDAFCMYCGKEAVIDQPIQTTMPQDIQPMYAPPVQTYNEMYGATVNNSGSLNEYQIGFYKTKGIGALIVLIIGYIIALMSFEYEYIKINDYELLGKGITGIQKFAGYLLKFKAVIKNKDSYSHLSELSESHIQDVLKWLFIAGIVSCVLGIFVMIIAQTKKNLSLAYNIINFNIFFVGISLFIELPILFYYYHEVWNVADKVNLNPSVGIGLIMIIVGEITGFVAILSANERFKQLLGRYNKYDRNYQQKPLG